MADEKGPKDDVETTGSKIDAEEGSRKSVLQPGEVVRPSVSQEMAVEITQRLFGLQVKKIKELNSYDDRNFHILVEEQNNNNPHLPEISPHGYTLKVQNSLDSQKPGFIDGMNALLLFLHEQGFEIPYPVKNVDGKFFSLETLSVNNAWAANNVVESSGALSRHAVRLMAYVPGKILYEVPFTADLFYQCGRYAALLNAALQDFHHPVFDTHTTLWSMENVPALLKFVYAVKGDDRQALVREVVQAFKETVPPNYPHLPKGQIHGDFNEQNVIVRPSPNNASEYQVTGILDFGDTHISYYVFEVAMVIMYMCTQNKCMPQQDVGGHVLAGYTNVRPVSDTELDILKVCVASRYCVSLTMGEYAYSLDPGNEYLLTTAKRGWQQLKQIWVTPKEEFICRWREIMDSYKK